MARRGQRSGSIAIVERAHVSQLPVGCHTERDERSVVFQAKVVGCRLDTEQLGCVAAQQRPQVADGWHEHGWGVDRAGRHDLTAMG